MSEPGKIYTRTGDRGLAAALDGKRLPKSDALFRALGSLEELNASLGRAAADPSMPGEIRGDLYRIQSCIFVAGAVIAGADSAASSDRLQSETTWMEDRIDSTQAALPLLTHFILPGGSPAGAALHWSRTICRRAESEAVACCGIETQASGAAGAAPSGGAEHGASSAGTGPDSPACVQARTAMLAWLNRLSDALFVFARHANLSAGVAETEWKG